jgi:RHS repeat-associated protein
MHFDRSIEPTTNNTGSAKGGPVNRLPGIWSGPRRPAWGRGLVVLAGLLNGAAAFAQSVATANPFDVTRSSSFTYYQAADGAQQGLLKTETVEPNDPRLCATTTYLYDGYGNKTGSTIAPCASAPATSSFSSRGASSAYAAVPSQQITVAGVSTSVAVPGGALLSSATNALSQQESHTSDPRFGMPLTMTGPNSLTTSWTYDDFGRTTRELHADGTSVVTMYCILAGDTSSNSSGCAALVFAAGERPPAADQFVHSEPRDASDHKMGPYQRVFLDAEGRTLRASTQSFDGSGQPTAVGGVVVQDTVYSPLGAVIVSTQPYFLATGSSTIAGAGDVGATYTQYDLMGRPVRVYQADPHGSQGSVAFASWGSRVASLTQFKYTAGTTTSTDDLGRTLTEEKDLAGHVVRITDQTGAQLARQYDAVGGLVQTKDALQNLITVTYDTRGNKLSMLDPDSGLTLYCYDAMGQLKAQQTAKMRGNNTPVACPADIDSTTTAKAEAGWTTMAYDVLGRLRQRAEPEDISTWSYDTYADGSTCPKGVGKLCESKSSVGSGHRYAFDAFGRVVSSSVTTNSAGTSGFATSVTYDAATGHPATKTYPSGLQIGYAYTAGGFLSAVKLASQFTVNPLPHTTGGSPGASAVLPSGSALWTATTVDAWSHAASDSLGNGVTDRTTFDPSTGRPTQMVAGAGATGTGVLNLAYVWDNVGRVQTRTDNNGAGGAVVDGYQYDGVDRLVQYVVQAPGVPGYSRTVTMQYNAIGNLLYKSDVGTYAYAAYGNTGGTTNPLPHAVATVTDNIGVPTHYQYDAGGNMVSADRGKYRGFSYTSFNLPDSTTGLTGNASYTYVYDEKHQRIKETHVDGSGTQVTWFANPDNAGGLAFESTTSAAGVLNNRHYISAGSQTIVLVTTGALPGLSAGQTAPSPNMTMVGVKVEYWHKDFLGNLVSTTDHTGAVTAYYAYDPFGKRRTTGGAYDANGSIVVPWSTTLDNGTGRGYTTHEQLDDVGIVHMNGRLFDPTIGRFLQTDPMLQSPDDLQNYNRYSYCLNNPVTCTDPSGRSFWGNLTGVNPMRNFLASYKLGDPLGYWINTRIAHNRIGYQLGAIAIAVVSAYFCEGGAAACDAVGMAAWAGMAGQSTSQALKTGAIAGVTTLATMGVDAAIPVNASSGFTAAAENVVAHAAVGCASARLSGGSCQSGAASAAVSAAWSDFVPNRGLVPGQGMTVAVENTMIQATVGGVASVAGGGSFSDGAMTSAFNYALKTGLQSAMPHGPGRTGQVMADVAGKIWGAPNTAIGLIAGSLGYAAQWTMYEAGITDLAPEVHVRNNAVEFVHNPVGGWSAITFGNVEMFGDSNPGSPDNGNQVHSTEAHEQQHTFQNQVVGPLYFPLAGLSLLMGAVLDNNSHGPSSFMECGPQKDIPTMWCGP